MNIQPESDQPYGAESLKFLQGEAVGVQGIARSEQNLAYAHTPPAEAVWGPGGPTENCNLHY